MPSPSMISEHLIALTCQGDARARDRVLHHFAPIWSAYLRQWGVQTDDAEEILNVQFMAVVDKAHKVTHPLAFPAFYETNLRRLIYSHYRDRRRRPQGISLDAPTSSEQDGASDKTSLDRLADTRTPSPIDHVLRQEKVRQVHQALARLKPEQATTLKLFLVNELSYQEIADLLRIPVGTVQSRLFNGRRRLKKLLAHVQD
jgi:RNA polymerase sigma-70 factor (ECF subfamily)